MVLKVFRADLKDLQNELAQVEQDGASEPATSVEGILPPI
jgi:hypothetical protein